MNSAIAATAALCTAIAAAGGGVVWNRYLGAPAHAPEPMPPHLIALDSPRGQVLLAGSDQVADYDELVEHFIPQTRRAFCGVASALTTLNAAKATASPLDQKALFAHPGVDANPLKVSFTGMSLRDFGSLLRAHGATVTVVHASDTDLDRFRELARRNLAREGDFLLVNYQRSHLGQSPMGHISPVAAYHEASDRMLVLDVAAHRYPPTWVETEILWKAMRAPLNESVATTRGFVVVEGVHGTGAR